MSKPGFCLKKGCWVKNMTFVVLKLFKITQPQKKKLYVEIIGLHDL